MRRRRLTMKQIERADPKLAAMIREGKRLRSEPLLKLKKAAMAYGKFSTGPGRGLGAFLGDEARELLATAVGFYVFTGAMKKKNLTDNPQPEKI